MIKLRFITLLLLSMTLAACSTKTSYFEAISSEPFSLYTMTADNPVIVEGAETKIYRNMFIFVPTGYMPALEDAVEQILQENRGDYLTNVKVKHTTINFMFLYYHNSWHVKADVNRVLR